MPFERSLAVLQGREFLETLAFGSKYRLPAEVRHEARQLLRHFPSRADVELAAKALPLFWESLDSDE
jgi:hypothetical protein